MESTDRLFPFKGSDSEYIKYLESMLLEVRPSGHPSSRPSSHQIALTPRSGQSNFVNLSQNSFPPKSTKGKISKPSQKVPQWELELRRFLSSVPSARNWTKARETTGFATVDRNRLAIQILLGRPASSVPSFSFQDSDTPLLLPTDEEDLINRGCEYGRFVVRSVDDGKFAVRVSKYQQLIFVCYCTVLIHVGNSKETVNWMMRRFISDTDDKNLERHRSGCLWVNRCIAGLLEQRWGYKSWELFILFAQSVHQYGRFADNKKSMGYFTRSMGEGETPIFEEGWVPYCIPCIVKFIAGDKIE
ncbi:hypothetical protein POX_c04567 [Penicillium oxalicum]|uniref:hypothetical protein n=1 Tax=Penicillium oxalicum TaxID=69781 RepID=UPI0020B84DFA|nr:hypothetical protein POX_c04567 [Penicillium oxalicum]KAI2791698.1 hypothetical protein POX_c04567 [Penicillium oxalicum]